MKHLLIMLLSAIIILLSCKKSTKTIKSTPTITYTNTGYIKGPNLSMSVCGAGYWIVPDGQPAFQTFVDPLPPGSGIDLATATFPINVKFNWHLRAEPNPCGYIVIDAIQKIN